MDLPETLHESHQQIIKSHHTITALERELTYLKEKMRLMQMKFWGRSSEKRPPESSPQQTLLFPIEHEHPALPEKKEKISYERRTRVEGKLPEGVRFPDSLPRETTIIDEAEGTEAVEKVTERLAAHRSAFYVKKIVRKVRKVNGSLQNPELPEPLLHRTTVDVSFLVYVILAKYQWHLPLYRQEQMLKGQQIRLSRDTLIRYVIACAALLKPIYVALGVELFQLSHLFGDETPVTVKLKEKGYSETRFWAFMGDLGCAFYHTPTRAFKEVEPLIKSFQGKLQCDGYTVYEKIAKSFPDVVLVGCWAHVRRKFVEAEQGSSPELAKEALRYIRALYRIERWCCDKELKPPEIARRRRRYSQKILDLFHQWLTAKSSNPELLPKSLLMGAVLYTLKRWDALSRYIDDPQLAIDSNAIEREFRPIAIGRKNWLFCASEVGAESSAIIYSLIASCRLANVDPWHYLTDVLNRISDHPASRITELFPCNWTKLIEKEKLHNASSQPLPHVA